VLGGDDGGDGGGGAADDITFSSTVDDDVGGQTGLQVVAARRERWGDRAVGGSLRSASLTVSSSVVTDVFEVHTTGAISVTAGTRIDVNGSAIDSNDGNIDY